VGAAFLQLRALLVAPALLLLATLLWTSAEPRPRVVAATACFGMMLAFFVSEAVAMRRREISERYLLVSMLFTQLGIALVAVTSGGLQSPVVPLLLAPTGVGVAAFGSQARGRTVATGLLLSLVGVGLGAHLLGWPPMLSPLREGMTLAACVMCGALLYLAIGRLSDAYVSAGSALLRTQSALNQILEQSLASFRQNHRSGRDKVVHPGFNS
jgi:hypothetical protein